MNEAKANAVRPGIKGYDSVRDSFLRRVVRTTNVLPMTMLETGIGN
jgi:hypothetical protein